jgi:hypothetical protein
MSIYQDYLATLENLTATQRRCTELLEEARKARQDARDALITAEMTAVMLRAVVEELVKVRDECAMLTVALNAKARA